MATHTFNAVEDYQPQAEDFRPQIEGHQPAQGEDYQSLSGPLLDKPPMRVVTAAGMPEESKATGGYMPAYAHLSHLPLFTLHSDKATKQMQQSWDRYDRGLETFREEPLIGRAMASLALKGATMACEQIMLAQFTRWTLPANVAADLDYGKTLWFVDMLEYRWTGEESKRAKMAKVTGNSIQVKPGLQAGMPKVKKVTLKFLDFEAKKLKSQEGWSKKVQVKEMCEALTLVVDGEEVQMEVVARVQRMCAVPEARAFAEQFDKWQVPVL